jgi:hypothetical protein
VVVNSRPTFAAALKAASEDVEAKHATLREHMSQGIPSMAGVEYADALERFTSLFHNAAPEIVAVLEIAETIQLNYGRSRDSQYGSVKMSRLRALKAALDVLNSHHAHLRQP